MKFKIHKQSVEYKTSKDVNVEYRHEIYLSLGWINIIGFGISYSKTNSMFRFDFVIFNVAIGIDVVLIMEDEEEYEKQAKDNKTT